MSKRPGRWTRMMRYQVVLATPRLLERRYRFRVSVSLRLAGVHFKVRRGTTFRHLNVGFRRMSAYGTDFSRLTLWAGTFTTRDGQRTSSHGVVLTAAVVSHPSARDLPFAPERRKARVASSASIDGGT